MEVTPDQCTCRKVIAGESIVMQVTVTLFNPNLSSITWSKSDKDLSTEERVTIKNTMSDSETEITDDKLSDITAAIKSTLELREVRAEDAGNYYVTATNSGISNTTEKFSLAVQGTQADTRVGLIGAACNHYGYKTYSPRPIASKALKPFQACALFLYFTMVL